MSQSASDAAGPRHAPFSSSDIQAVVKSSFAIDAAITVLPGEVDHNFLVAADDVTFVLRLSPPGTSQAMVRFQVALARHLESKPVAAIVQKVVPNAAGQEYWHCAVAGRDGYLARSTTFLPGVLQRETSPTCAQRAALGGALASVQLALADFHHSESRPDLVWDLLQGEKVRHLATELGDGQFAGPIQALDDYLRRTLPVLRTMPAQVCHNDLNSNNVLVDVERPDVVTGVLDFGDAIHTAAIADVAVGAAYNLGEGDDLLRGAAEFVSGFRALKHLAAAELAVLPRLILARLAVRIIISEWRARDRPQNRDYVLRNTPLAWSQFDRLYGMGPDLEEQFKRASR